MTVPDHTLHVLVEFLQHHNVRTLLWPARSPDLNPIEHLWDILNQRVHRKYTYTPPQTLPKLLTVLQHEWQNIPRVVQRLVAFMRHDLN